MMGKGNGKDNKHTSTDAFRVIPVIKNADSEDGDEGNDSKSDDEFEPQQMPCNHPNWTHDSNPKDFENACSYLCLVMDPDDAEDRVGKFMKKSDAGNVEHYKPKDLLRASKLPLLPADNPDVAQQLAMTKTGQKLSPPLVIRGEDGHHSLIAAGYHRTMAGYYDDMNQFIPCIVVKPV